MSDHGSIDPSGTTPSAAGVWHYWLGGKDYWPIEREAGNAIRADFDRIGAYAANSRAWLVRAVRYAAHTLGHDQFLDVGAGLPTDHNTHQIATAAQPGARTLYVDIDPRVVLHQDTMAADGHVACLEADMRETDTILATARAHLDLTRPVALFFSDCLGHIPDTDDALGAVQRLVSQLPSGSHLLLSHSTSSSDTPYTRVRYHARPPEVIARFFAGLELLDPGLVSVQDWHPDGNTPTDPDLHQSTYAAAARIP